MSLVTLGVHDLAVATAFYTALGWRGQEVEQTVFFQTGGMVLTLWDRASLAADCGLSAAGSCDAGSSDAGSTVAGDRFGGIALAHNVRSRAEVDAVLAEARAAGARISRPATETSYGGYAGVFTDPDGHPWEVSHNPGFLLGDDGTLTVLDLGDAVTS